MAFTTSTPVPIVCVGNSNPGNPAGVTNGNIGEAASQTYLGGTPIALSSGNYAAWGGANPAGLPVILGVAIQGGQNLSTAATAQHGNFGSVPNQSSAKNLYFSGPVDAAGVGGAGNPYYTWGNGNRFTALFGNNGASATPAITDVGVYYGLTKDATTGYWYVDKNKATQGTSTAVRIVGLDPGTSANGASISSTTLVIFEGDPATVQPS